LERVIQGNRDKDFAFGAHLPRVGPGTQIEVEDALLRHARESNVVDSVVTQFGTKYRIDGRLRTPDGRDPRVRAVWFVGTGEQRPRFVTAYSI